MTEGKDFLNSILTTVQTEQAGIQTVLKTPMRPSLRRCLESQLKEYISIEREVMSIAFARGWELRELEPAAKAMTRMTVKLKLFHGHNDSNVAAMRIGSSTKGLIAGTRDHHQFNKTDLPLTTISQKLLDCENANIRQMQGFL